MASARLIHAALVGFDGLTAPTALGGVALVTAPERNRCSVRLLRGTAFRSSVAPGVMPTIQSEAVPPVRRPPCQRRPGATVLKQPPIVNRRLVQP